MLTALVIVSITLAMPTLTSAATPSVISSDGASVWAYGDAYDSTPKREGGYLRFNSPVVETFYASDGSAYDSDDATGWWDQAAFEGKGPHGGYDTTTNKCKACHAVHRAEGSHQLLRATSPDDACAYCHVGGSAHSSVVVYFANPAGTRTENGHTMGAGPAIPDSTTHMETATEEILAGETSVTVLVRRYEANQKQLYRIVGYGGDPASHPSYESTTSWFSRLGPTTLSCSSCHQAHNASAQIWRPQAYSPDGTATAGFLTQGYKLLRRFPGATAYGNPPAGLPIEAADLAKVPESRLTSDVNYSSSVSLETTYTENGEVFRQPDWIVPNGFSGEATGAATVVNQYTLAVWCADCHNLSIGGAPQETGDEEAGSTAVHGERTHPVPSIAAFGGGGGGFQCYSCHRNDLDYGMGCSMCHYSATDYRARIASAPTDFPHSGSDAGYKLLGAYSWAPDDVDPTSDWPLEAMPIGPDNLDAVCLRCHDTNGSHPPYGAGVDGHGFPPEFAACTTCHGIDASVVHASTPSGCHACHGADVTPSLVCSDCHAVVYPPPHDEVDHSADQSATPNPTGFTCGDCHEMYVIGEHAKPSSSTSGDGCTTCHPSPRDTADPWAQGCVQGGCHAVGSPSEQHSNETTAHVLPSGAGDCMGSGCHSGASLVAVHADAGSGSITSCLVCHATGVPSTNECLSCHPGRDEPHSYDVALHTPALDYYDDILVFDEHEGVAPTTRYERCSLCHQGDLAALHGGQCSTCHPSPVDEEPPGLPLPWNKDCSTGACHPAYHDAADPGHTAVPSCEDCHDPVTFNVSCGDCHTVYP